MELAHRPVTEHDERFPRAKAEGVKAVDHARQRLDKGPDRKLHMVREPRQPVLDYPAGDPDHLGETARLRSDLHKARAQRRSSRGTHIAHAARDVRRDRHPIAHPPLRLLAVVAIHHSA
jgi:hypothetical protein